MKPREPRESGQHDMFRSRLDQILDRGHEKVILADKINWRFLSDRMAAGAQDVGGQRRGSRSLQARFQMRRKWESRSAGGVWARVLESPY